MVHPKLSSLIRAPRLNSNVFWHSYQCFIIRQTQKFLIMYKIFIEVSSCSSMSSKCSDVSVGHHKDTDRFQTTSGTPSQAYLQYSNHYCPWTDLFHDTLPATIPRTPGCQLSTEPNRFVLVYHGYGFIKDVLNNFLRSFILALICIMAWVSSSSNPGQQFMDLDYLSVPRY